jgi:hypothetical protein
VCLKNSEGGWLDDNNPQQQQDKEKYTMVGESFVQRAPPSGDENRMLLL